jgi:hypothetical protein
MRKFLKRFFSKAETIAMRTQDIPCETQLKDPELEDAKERVVKLEELVDKRILAGIEWERNIESARRGMT